MTDNILEEIKNIRKEVENLSAKVDLILDVLNNFTIMLEEVEEEEEEKYDNDTWVSDDDEFWRQDN